jgi:hypothetical protein
MSRHRYGFERDVTKVVAGHVRAEMEPGMSGVKLRFTVPELGQRVEAGEISPQVLVDMGAPIDPNDRSTWRGSLKLSRKFVERAMTQEPIKAFES